MIAENSLALQSMFSFTEVLLYDASLGTSETTLFEEDHRNGVTGDLESIRLSLCLFSSTFYSFTVATT